MRRVIPHVRGRRARASSLALALGLVATRVEATPPTPGFPEPVVQWGVQEGETCESIATALYGAAKHAHLLLRYNRIACTRGAPLRAGTTLVLPATVTEVPSARVDSLNPNVRARPAGGAWSTATVGQPLASNSNVNTLETGRAGIGFVDRTRIVLAENTLVIIYGTAAATAVATTRPPAVEVEEGEARAALAALRGPGRSAGAELGVAGGRVVADSNETIVQKKGKRATVSVFDGSATVESAGSRVVVPKNHASRFLQSQPPSAPRPLPPAPVWESAPRPIVMALDGTSIVTAAWGEVPKARAYRVEVARDDAFTDVVVREEVPASVRRFRAENLPPASYFVRVRAIDDEDYLGIADVGRRFQVVSVAIRGGQGGWDGDRLRVDAAARLELAAGADLEAGIAEDALAPAPPSLSASALRGGKLWLRGRGGTAVAFDVRVDDPPRVAPPPPAPRVAAPPPRPELRRWVGPTMPFVSLDARTDVIPTAPTARSAVAISALADGGPDHDAHLAGRAFGSGAVGPVSLDALLTTTGDEGTSAWLGARGRLVQTDGSGFELAPVLRLGLPTRDGATTRLDAALAVGGLGPRFSWLADLGTRVRLGDGTAATPDGVVPYAIGGAAWDPSDFLRLFATLDAQLLVLDVDSSIATEAVQPGGGLSLGVELGAGPFFAGLSGRVSPFFAARALGPEPVAAAQLAVGVRLPSRGSGEGEVVEPAP